MADLYPLKFTPILKNKIWGGTKMKSIFSVKEVSGDNCGESWEISGVQDNISVVSNGFLTGNDLQELIEIYMDELVGEKVYEKFGMEFPLLIKFIDTGDLLSIQVHPDDEVAKERHKAFGKTEMWYVLDAEKDSELIVGFNETISRDVFLENVVAKKLPEILNFESVKQGDVFFLPAGRVHAIGKGLLLAEIQQTSDITYRIYDWDRQDTDGNYRELHLDLALDVMDYEKKDSYRTEYAVTKNISSELVKCQYFTTNLLQIDNTVSKDYSQIDSFVIYMMTGGKATILYSETDSIHLEAGETILVPACLEHITIIPDGDNAELLEVYID